MANARDRKRESRQRKRAAGLVLVHIEEWVPADRSAEYRRLLEPLKAEAQRLRAERRQED